MKIQIIGEGSFGSFLNELLSPIFEIDKDADSVILAVPDLGVRQPRIRSSRPSSDQRLQRAEAEHRSSFTLYAERHIDPSAFWSPHTGRKTKFDSYPDC